MVETETENGGSASGGSAMFDTMSGFARMWSDFAMKMMTSGMAANPGSPPPEAARQMRSAVFKAMSEQCEQFMRSPAFLDSMKQSLGAAVELRTQLNDFLNQVHHEMQSVARDDVDTIMLTIRHFESRVLDRLEQLEQRIDALAGDAAAPRPRTAGKPRSKPTPAKSAKARKR